MCSLIFLKYNGSIKKQQGPTSMKLPIIFFFAYLLTACTNRIETTKTTLYRPDYQSRGSIVVMPKDPTKSNSLEFANVKVKFERKLNSIGYSISNDKSDHIALIEYGIDNGTEETRDQTMYNTHPGRKYTEGKGKYKRTYEEPTTYTYAGIRRYRATYYTRYINLDIIDRLALEQEKLPTAIEKKLELRSTSIGSCPQLFSIFDEILEGVFRNFPGFNGQTVQVVIESEENKCWDIYTGP